MKKKFAFLFSIFLFSYLANHLTAFAQNKKVIDSLEKLLANHNLVDTNRATVYISLGRLYYTNDLQKAIDLTTEGLKLSKKNNFLYGEASSLHWIGMYQNFKGSNDKSIYSFLQSLQISEQIGNKELIGANLSRIADINREQKNYVKSFEMHSKAIDILRKTTNKLYLTNALHRAGLLFKDQKNYEEALIYFIEALLLGKEIKSQNQTALCSYYIGEVYYKQNKNEKALIYLEQSRVISAKINNFIQLSRALNLIGQIYLRKGNTQRAIAYNYEALEIANKVNATPEIKDIYISLYEGYKKLAEIDSALHYFEYGVMLKDSLYNKDKDNLIHLLQIDGEIERQKIELDKKEIEIEKKDILIYSFVTLVMFILSIVGILSYNNNKQQNANLLLSNQKEEILMQKYKIQEQNNNLQILNEETIQQREEIEAVNNHLEDLVEDRTNELKSTLDNLTKQNQDLSQFSFIISHNLRAPVARILGLVNIFNTNDYNDGFNKEIVGHLKQATIDLDTVIKDLTKIISIRNDLNKTKEEINIIEVITLEKILLQTEIEKTKTIINTELVNENKLFFIKSYFQSILHNLISNAIKYKAEERNPIINIRTEVVDNFICLSVQDNGLGIDLENTDAYKIFGLYQRMHDHVEGKGMGLFLVKTQIESLGGKIEIESKLGVGTTFKAYFLK